MTKLALPLLLLLAASLVDAQGTASISTTQNFTAATTGAVIPNNPTTAGGPAGSVGFRMVYYIQPGSGTVSALSLELDGAATSGGSYTALTPASGGGSGSGATTNPVTSFPEGQNNLCCDYYPFLQIKVNTLTVASGAPILVVKILGYAGTSAAANGSGGGGGGVTCLSGDVLAGTGTGCTAATVQGIKTVPFCSGYSPTNGQFVQYTTGGSPNPCYGAAPAGGSSVATGLTVYSGLAGISLSGATIFFPIGGGSLASATEASVNTFQGTGGIVSGFGTDISAALGTTVVTPNSVVLTWRKNGANQAVTCTITNPATTCSDTTHFFSFAAGDALDIQAVFTGTIAAAPIWVMNAGVSSSTGSPGMILVEEHTASNSAALQFTAITSTYDTYQITFTGVFSAAGGAFPLLQFSTNGGSSYDTATHYNWSQWISGGGTLHASANADTAVNMANFSDAADNLSDALIATFIFTPGINARLTGTLSYGRATDGVTADPIATMLSGSYTVATAVNAFQFLFSTGNISAGTVRLYGMSR